MVDGWHLDRPLVSAGFCCVGELLQSGNSTVLAEGTPHHEASCSFSRAGDMSGEFFRSLRTCDAQPAFEPYLLSVLQALPSRDALQQPYEIWTKAAWLLRPHLYLWPLSDIICCPPQSPFPRYIRLRFEYSRCWNQL